MSSCKTLSVSLGFGSGCSMYQELYWDQTTDSPTHLRSVEWGLVIAYMKMFWQIQLTGLKT